MTAEPKIAAVVLAAGRSSRMGAHNKLLALLDGEAIARRVAEAALASRARPVLVVTGHEEDRVRVALAGLDVTFASNPDYATGLSSSLKAGIRALPEDCAGVVVLLGDMPRISGSHVDRLIAAFAARQGTEIIVPTYDGQRGNPVLWPRAYFAAMLRLDGDAGAGRLIAAHAGQVHAVDLGTDAILADVDTPEALARMRAGSTFC